MAVHSQHMSHKMQGESIPLRALTKVLNVLIGKESHGSGSGTLTSLGTSAHSLIDDDTVGDGRSDKGSAVRELSHTSVVVHSQPREAISDCCQDQSEMSNKGCLLVTDLRFARGCSDIPYKPTDCN